MPPNQPGIPVRQLPPQDPARVFLTILILIFFLFSTPDQGVTPGFQSPRDYAAQRAIRARHSLDILNSSRWQDFSPKGPTSPRGEASRHLNLTGFREDDGYAWDRFSAFQQRSREFSAEARGTGDGTGKGLMGAVFGNVTGVVVGKWVRHTHDLNGEQRQRDMNLTEISPGIDWAYRDKEYWTRNITGNEGRLQIRIDERDVGAMSFDTEGQDLEREENRPPTWYTDYVTEVEASVVVQDETSSGDGWEMRVHGVHWPRQGVMLMTTTSEKFAGIFGLPHLSTDMNHFTTSQKLLNQTLEAVVEDMERSTWGDSGNPWTATPNSQGDASMPAPHCEFLVYAQVYPVDSEQGIHAEGSMNTIVRDIEQELRFPNGAPVPRTPDMHMSTVMFSPDCGFILESKGPPSFPQTTGKHLTGKKQEVWLREIQYWLHMFALVVLGQIFLMKMQSKEASTPSTLGRVSFYTIGMMLMADALLFSSMSIFSATITTFFPSALLTSFAAFLSTGFGGKFIGAVYNVQEPERLEREREQERNRLQALQAAQASRAQARAASANVTPGPIITAAGADVAPAPAPATSNPTPIIIPSDQDIDAEIAEVNAAPAATLPTTNGATTPPPRGSNFGAVYMKSVLAMMIIMFTTLSATTWPVGIRSAYVHTLSFIYLSFWLPQIRRNAIRNCRKALLWKFVVGQSILRLLPFAYFYLKEDNVMFAATDWKAFCALAGWVWIQIWVLVAQEVLGPRWGLPKSWTEEGWDYHPILREDNVEAGGLPIGLVQIPSSPTLERRDTGDEQGLRKKKDGSVRSVDCAICMQVLEVPVVAAGDDTSGPSAAGGVAGMLARRLYMVTPCRHVFHGACLEGWMRYRLQCPICRENLPPL